MNRKNSADNRSRGYAGHRRTGQKKERDTKKTPLRMVGVLRVSAGGTGTLRGPDNKPLIRIENESLGLGLNGDTVEVSVRTTTHGAHGEARVEKVIIRKKIRYVGTITKEERGVLYLEPQDLRMHMRIAIPKEHSLGGTVGQKALAKIVHWTDPNMIPEGEILKVIGRAEENETEMLALLLDRGIESGFPEEVEREAAALTTKKRTIIDNALKERRDLRNVTTFTIDPDNAKDFDDALSYRILPDGSIEIGVHIADVSGYVAEGTKLDTEAKKRGTSVYLVDRTVPMLPEALSNDLCSLTPGEDKLAFSVIFTFGAPTKKGVSSAVRSYSVERTVIRSDKRFTYEEAQSILETGKGPFADELHTMNELAKHMAEKNKRNGALSFSQEEVSFVLNAAGKPIDVRVKKAQDAHTLIENFMLLANKTVTEYVHANIPEHERLFMYRIHGKPEKERVIELVALLRGLGYTLRLKNGELGSSDINAVLRSSEGTAEANMIHMATIRSMAKAIYSIHNIGHFGLAFSTYTHFTSPIRRYPDIIVHRLIQTYQRGKRIPESRWNEYQTLANDLSEKERNAMDAERDSIRLKQVEFLETQTKNELVGVISSVTEWGLYIEESRTKAEGLVRMRDLTDDHYEYHKDRMSLIGIRKGRTYRLGDPVRIKIKRLDAKNRIIEYTLL